MCLQNRVSFPSPIFLQKVLVSQPGCSYWQSSILKVSLHHWDVWLIELVFDESNEPYQNFRIRAQIASVSTRKCQCHFTNKLMLKMLRFLIPRPPICLGVQTVLHFSQLIFVMFETPFHKSVVVYLPTPSSLSLEP